jgi:Leucine-rich repeat (LRR) protein
MQENLVNLEWLDLSFNKIEKIQNLGSQTRLKVLALFNNKIAEIENIEHLQELGIIFE